MMSLNLCSHKFCQYCLVEYVVYKINVHEAVLCPEENCPEKLVIDSPICLLLEEKIRNRFREQELWRQTMSNPNVKLCPREDCKSGLVDLTIQPPQCRKCRKQFCKNCMMEYHAGSCDDNFMQHFRNFRRCPRCGITIQKISGCDQMTCICGHHFDFNSWRNHGF